jgi:hypothetical protein
MEEDVKIEFFGFLPNSTDRILYKDLSERLLCEAPTWSCLRAKIDQVGTVFRGFVRITSHVRTFAVRATANKADEVGARLFTKMQHQLKKWKAERFSNEKPPDHTYT